MEYISQISATGGRGGRVWNESGSLDTAVGAPGVRAEGVTPEELLAAAWGACYGSAYAAEARAAGVATDPKFEVEVVLSVHDGIYTISRAALRVVAPDDDPSAVRATAALADARCPISKMFGNGIDEVIVTTVAEHRDS